METDERIKQHGAAYWAYLKEMYNNPELAEETWEWLSKKMEEEQEERKYPNRWKRKIKELILA